MHLIVSFMRVLCRVVMLKQFQSVSRSLMRYREILGNIGGSLYGQFTYIYQNLEDVWRVYFKIKV